jgi:hypothetical protein
MKSVLKRITPLLSLYRFFWKKKNEFYNWYTIPSYKTKRETILSVARKYDQNTVFIETGTYMGDTVEYVKNQFSKVFSIELSQELAEKARQRFSAESKISIVQGDSATQLGNILQSVNAPCLLWLDGHYSSEFWVGDKYVVTAKGVKETPILEELRQVANHSIKNHVILIDDARLFVGKNDYPPMSELRSFVAANFPGYSIAAKNDIIRILPKLSNA